MKNLWVRIKYRLDVWRWALSEKLAYLTTLANPATKRRLTVVDASLAEALEIIEFLPGGERHNMPFGETMTETRALEELKEELEKARKAVPRALVLSITQQQQRYV
jgi:hypothetical protein